MWAYIIYTYTRHIHSTKLIFYMQTMQWCTKKSWVHYWILVWMSLVVKAWESPQVCSVCIWRCEHARFHVGVFSTIHIIIHSFIQLLPVFCLAIRVFLRYPSLPNPFLQKVSLPALSKKKKKKKKVSWNYWCKLQKEKWFSVALCPQKP